MGIALAFSSPLDNDSMPRRLTGYVMDDSSIRTAVDAWLSGDTATYGHISTWETGAVTDMAYLFCGSQYNSATSSFVYVDQAKSFDDARAYCRANYHDLASIHSSSENAAVAALCPGTCWIGGSDAAQEGTWTWSDGTAWDYENWDSGEPNNSGGDEPYTVIYDSG